MEIWEREELELPCEITESSSEGDGKLRLLRQPKRSMRAFWSPSVNRIIITVERVCFSKYVEEELGHIYYYYNAEITEHVGAVINEKYCLRDKSKNTKVYLNNLLITYNVLRKSLVYFRNDPASMKFNGTI